MNPLLTTAVSLFSSEQLSSAYDDPVTACSLYALLDPCSQTIIDHLLYIDGPLPFHHIRTLHSVEQRSDWNKALLALKQLNVLQGRGQEVWVNSKFQRNLITGIAINARPHGDIVTTVSQSDTSVNDYEDVVYKLITNSKDLKTAKNRRPIQELFEAGRLIERDQVTRAGFQFLVQPIHLQLWTLMSIKLCTGGIDLFKSMLSVIRLSADCRYENNVDYLKDLFLLDRNSNRPTSLHRLLTNPANPSSLQITVETNFHLYALFPTQLSLAVLSLFCTPKDRLPNLFRGRLTHQSVRSALKRGITAHQLCLYLSSHSSTPPPSTLLDQVHLWEQDLRRVRSLPDPVGFMYQQFGKQQDFARAVVMVKEHRLPVLYENAERRILIVDQRGHDLLRGVFT